MVCILFPLKSHLVLYVFRPLPQMNYKTNVSAFVYGLQGSSRSYKQNPWKVSVDLGWLTATAITADKGNSVYTAGEEILKPGNVFYARSQGETHSKLVAQDRHCSKFGAI